MPAEADEGATERLTNVPPVNLPPLYHQDLSGESPGRDRDGSTCTTVLQVSCTVLERCAGPALATARCGLALLHEWIARLRALFAVADNETDNVLLQQGKHGGREKRSARRRATAWEGIAAPTKPRRSAARS